MKRGQGTVFEKTKLTTFLGPTHGAPRVEFCRILAPVRNLFLVPWMIFFDGRAHSTMKSNFKHKNRLYGDYHRQHVIKKYRLRTTTVQTGSFLVTTVCIELIKIFKVLRNRLLTTSKLWSQD